MRVRWLYLLPGLLALCAPLHGQATMVSDLTASAPGLVYTSLDDEFDTGARLSGTIDWAVIPKKAHLSLEEEFRLNGNFSHPDKCYTNVTFDYKVLPWLKTGVSYSFILSNSTKNGWRVRNRAAAHANASFKTGLWKFSLKEKLQFTKKAYSVNLYQEPGISILLKSRVKAALNLPHCKWEPYAAAEMRNTFNAVNPKGFVYGQYKWTELTTGDDSDEQVETEVTGMRYGNLNPRYNDIYINRLRFQIGTEWNFRKNQSLDMFGIFDMNMGMEFDFNSKGIAKANQTKNPMIQLSNQYYFGIGLAYTFNL